MFLSLESQNQWPAFWLTQLTKDAGRSHTFLQSLLTISFVSSWPALLSSKTQWECFVIMAALYLEIQLKVCYRLRSRLTIPTAPFVHDPLFEK